MMMRYEWHAFVVVEGDHTAEQAEKIAADTLNALNQDDGAHVYLDDGPPVVEDDEE